MKRIVMLVALLPMLVALQGCQKEETSPFGLELVAEGFGSQAKATVSGNSSYWVAGERVLLWGWDLGDALVKHVTLRNGRAYLTEVGNEAYEYFALYPASLCRGTLVYDEFMAQDTFISSTEFHQITIPSSYVYREHGGRQLLDVPMAASYAREWGDESNPRLFFRHLTAAVTVELTNSSVHPIVVDSIKVISDHYRLAGDVDLGVPMEDLEYDDDQDRMVEAFERSVLQMSPVALNGADDTEACVTLTSEGGLAPRLAAEETRGFQLPVLPVGNDNRFTVKVYAHWESDPTEIILFEKTQSTGGALARAEMAYAGFEYRRSYSFSVSENTKVYFSPGNLQYQPSTGIWRFAEQQWHFVGCYNGQTRGNVYHNGYLCSNDSVRFPSVYQGWIDVFGWGTSGYGEVGPTVFSGVANASYGAPGMQGIAGTHYDWGVHNPIANGGNQAGMWRTPTYAEWDYLMDRYYYDDGEERYFLLWGIGTVEGAGGLILLPDEWQGVAGITFNSGRADRPTDGRHDAQYSETGNNYTAAQWRRMEMAGAVFLPANVYRGGYNFGGAYGDGLGGTVMHVTCWSADAHDDDGAKVLALSPCWMSGSGLVNYSSRGTGYSVRLVRDAN